MSWTLHCDNLSDRVDGSFDVFFLSRTLLISVIPSFGFWIAAVATCFRLQNFFPSSWPYGHTLLGLPCQPLGVFSVRTSHQSAMTAQTKVPVTSHHHQWRVWLATLLAITDLVQGISLPLPIFFLTILSLLIPVIILLFIAFSLLAFCNCCAQERYLPHLITTMYYYCINAPNEEPKLFELLILHFKFTINIHKLF